MTRLVAPGLLLLAVLACSPWLFAPGSVLMTTDAGRFLPWSAAQGPDESRLSYNQDHLRYVLPRKELVHESLREHGALPLWNPRAFLGTPFLEQWQSQVLYPPNVLLCWLDPGAALGRDVSLHMWIGALGTYLLLGSFGLGRPGRVAGALTCALAGPVIFRLGHPSFPATIAWLPWVLWGVERFFAKGRGRDLVLVGLAWTSLVLAGMATLVVWCGYLALAWVALRARRQTARAFCAGLALFAGTLLAAPQVLATLDLSRDSERLELSEERLRDRAVPYGRLVQVVAPDALGSAGKDFVQSLEKSVGRTKTPFQTGGSAFTGISALVLAVVGIAAAPRSPRRLFIAAAALFALGVTTGVPGITELYLLLPGFRFSTVTRGAVLWALCVGWLAGFGVEDLARRDRLSPGARGAIALTAAALAGAAAAVGLTRPMDGADRAAVLVLAAGIASATLVACAPRLPRGVAAPAAATLVFLELFAVGIPYRIVRPVEHVAPATPDIATLVEANRADEGRIAWFVRSRGFRLPPRGAMGRYGLREVGGMAPLHDSHLDRLLEALGWTVSTPWSVGAITDPRPLAAPAFATLDVAHVLVPHADGFRVDPAPPRLGAAWTVERVRCVDSFEDALAGVAAPGFDPARLAVVECDGAVPTAGRMGATVRVERPGPNRIRLTLDDDGPAFLVVSEAWNRGWRAEHPVFRTDGGLIGVAAASHGGTIELRYRPASWPVAWWISGFGIALLGIVACGRFRG